MSQTGFTNGFVAFKRSWVGAFFLSSLLLLLSIRYKKLNEKINLTTIGDIPSEILIDIRRRISSNPHLTESISESENLSIMEVLNVFKKYEKELIVKAVDSNTIHFYATVEVCHTKKTPFCYVYKLSDNKWRLSGVCMEIY